jgi:hypothetical protein
MEIVFNIVAFILGALVLYLTAYMKVKGKNKALIEDVARLEEEKQKVIKEHTLDVEKRKYQYESKRQEFTKYFHLLDEFHNRCNTAFVEKFQPITTAFYDSYLDENEQEQYQALVKYNEDVHLLFLELNSEQIKLKTETNSIRLIASPRVDELLDTLETQIEQATNLSTEMIKFMATPTYISDNSTVEPYQQEVAELGMSVIDLRNKLRNQMKLELDEI